MGESSIHHGMVAIKGNVQQINVQARGDASNNVGIQLTQNDSRGAHYSGSAQNNSGHTHHSNATQNSWGSA